MRPHTHTTTTAAAATTPNTHPHTHPHAQQQQNYSYLSDDNDRTIGTLLALASALMIGASFIVKKKGLRAAASTHANALRAASGGYSYLRSPLWWSGLLLMAAGEACNFVAYAFAPAMLVTPLGALSILVTAALAGALLGERLHVLGAAGCVLCVAGSAVIVTHAPEEPRVESVRELFAMATAPAFAAYAACAACAAAVLACAVAPRHGRSQILVYVSICSLMGSLSVMSCKALGIALKLTARGDDQMGRPETWFFALVVACCVVTVRCPRVRPSGRRAPRAPPHAPIPPIPAASLALTRACAPARRRSK